MHQITAPKANYNKADGSISVDDGAGIRHFTNADVARTYYAACIQAVGRVDPGIQGAEP